MSDNYYNLGDFRSDVTTSSPEAQLWFDRGLAWAYCFNPEEAVRCFEKAAKIDPDCAMAHWGIAFGSGPNYNKAWRLFDIADMEQSIAVATAALDRARVAANRNATPFERALIGALGARFPKAVTQDPIEFDRLNRAYADAMRIFYKQFSDDIDAAALFADSLMCLSPRALWDLDTCEPIGQVQSRLGVFWKMRCRARAVINIRCLITFISTSWKCRLIRRLPCQRLTVYAASRLMVRIWRICRRISTMPVATGGV